MSDLRAAFMAPANLIGLSGALGASLVTQDPTAALVAAGLEGVYLGLLSLFPPLRRWARARDRRVRPEQEVEAMLEALSPSQREHYFALRTLRDRIQVNYRKLPGGGVLASSSDQRVDALLTVFVRMLSTLNSYRSFLSIADRSVVERELKELRDELQSGDSPRLREVKTRRADILERRLERFRQAEESREVVSHQLAAIEDLLRLTHEQSIAIRDPATVENQLAALSAELETTQETVRDMERFLDFTEETAPPLQHGARVRHT